MLSPLKTLRKNSTTNYSRQMDHLFASRCIHGYLNRIEMEADRLGTELVFLDCSNPSDPFGNFQSGTIEDPHNEAHLEQRTDFQMINLIGFFDSRKPSTSFSGIPTGRKLRRRG